MLKLENNKIWAYHYIIVSYYTIKCVGIYKVNLKKKFK